MAIRGGNRKIKRGEQWRRNEFESGGSTSPARKWGEASVRHEAAVKIFGRAPLLFWL